MKLQEPKKIISDVHGQEATMYLYGAIGQDYGPWDEETITDVSFLSKLREFREAGVKRLHIRINSPGGLTRHMDGIIALMKQSNMEIHTWVDGTAASAAADIFLAAPKQNRHMHQTSKIMIHAPQAIVVGSAKDMRAMADTLDKLSEGFIKRMAEDTGMDEKEVAEKYYDGEDHWLTATEAKALGLINEIETFGPKPAEPTAQINGLFEKIMKFFEKEDVNQSAEGTAKIGDEMNIDVIRTSLGTGEIKHQDIASLLVECGYEVRKADGQNNQDQEPVTFDIDKIVKEVKDAVVQEFSSLKDEINAVKQQLDKTPGAPPALPKADADPTGDAEDDPLKEFESEFQKALRREVGM